MSGHNHARQIIQNVISGSLGTLTNDGTPFVSLVTVAATSPTTVVMLLSGLAKHTKHLRHSPACSLLLVEPGGESGDPLQGARLTITGTVARLSREEDPAARATFLAKHPGAAMYADFGDFTFFEITIQEAHLVAGFGRTQTLTPDQL